MNVAIVFMIINAENIVTWWILAFSMVGGGSYLHIVVFPWGFYMLLIWEVDS